MTRLQSAVKAVDAGTRVPDFLLPPRAPNVLAYGVGVDSTALLVELEARGEKPDLVITADTGVEKPETYDYQRMIAAFHPVSLLVGGHNGVARGESHFPLATGAAGKCRQTNDPRQFIGPRLGQRPQSKYPRRNQPTFRAI